jgi:hypothetical protein
MEGTFVAYQLICPCGEPLYGRTEEGIVAEASDHTERIHGRSYMPDEIMFLAEEIPDRLLPRRESRERDARRSQR